MFDAGRDIHPGIQMASKEKNRHKKNRQHYQQHRNVFQLAPHHHRPVGIGGMMHNRPEKAARAKREEKCECKEPRITELMRVQKCAHDAKRQRHNGNQSEERREPCKAAALEIFAYGCWGSVGTLAHCFSSSARRSSVTSAVFAFWLRCNARRYAMIAQRSGTTMFGP